MSKFNYSTVLLAVFATCIPLTAVQAEEGAAPFIEGEFEVELGDDYSTEPGNKTNDLFLNTALSMRFNVAENFAVNFGTTSEAVNDITTGTNRAFGDVGLYVDTLNVEMGFSNLTLVAGKFGPGFGTAWDVTPGVYGTGFAEDYELGEMLGFGAAYAVETNSHGTHTFAANVFMADTTFLSDALFTRRGPLKLSDGGVANTGTLNNFSVALDGADIPNMRGFNYHLGFRYLSAGVGDVADEKGFVGGLAYEHEIKGATWTWNSELAHFQNHSGTADHATYATLGLQLAKGSWHGELAATLRAMDISGGASRTDTLFQASVGYEFESGFDFSVGYNHTVDSGTASNTIGFRLTKTFEFSVDHS